MGTDYRQDEPASLFEQTPEFQRSAQQHPPYSVLDAAGGWWQQRRAFWTALGHRDAGARPTTYRRGAPAYSEQSGNVDAVAAQSQFSPVLSELIVDWYGGQTIYDPFAGGPTRGFVATTMGSDYLGRDLSAAQVAANREAYPDLADIWQWGDALDDPPIGVDCVLTCPPYHDVERYSDDPADLSAMTWDEFVIAHGRAIDLAARAVAPGGFVVWVVGDFRSPAGTLRGFPDLVAKQMDDAGLCRWNRHVVRQPLVTAQMRWRNAWINRKATTTHAEVIVGRRDG
jgi:hypothetical protein